MLLSGTLISNVDIYFSVFICPDFENKECALAEMAKLKRKSKEVIEAGKNTTTAFFNKAPPNRYQRCRT